MSYQTRLATHAVPAIFEVIATLPVARVVPWSEPMAGVMSALPVGLMVKERTTIPRVTSATEEFGVCILRLAVGV